MVGKDGRFKEKNELFAAAAAPPISSSSSSVCALLFSLSLPCAALLRRIRCCILCEDISSSSRSKSFLLKNCAPVLRVFVLFGNHFNRRAGGDLLLRWFWSFARGSKSGGDEGMDAEAGGEEERPRDDEILAFHNQIRAADAEKLEFVGDKVRCRYITYYY